MFYNRTWMEYKLGFDNGLENSLWLGNDKIHLLSTKDTTVELRIDIWGDRWTNTTAPNGYWFDKYTFFVSNITCSVFHGRRCIIFPWFNKGNSDV